jgi:hypothetical protein
MAAFKARRVGLFRDVVDDVDDFRNFQRGDRPSDLIFLAVACTEATDTLHAVQRVAYRPVALFGGIESATSGFGAGFGVVGNLFHRNR